MSLALKLLVLAASYVILWLQVFLDYKKPWSDRRTRVHKLAFGTLRFLLLPCAVVGSIAVLVLDDQAARTADAQMIEIKTTLDGVARVVGVAAPSEITRAVLELKARVAAQQEELKAAQRSMAALDVKAERAARGRTEAFDFNGVKHVSERPGHATLVDGPEAEVFKRMVELEKTQQWRQLLALSEKQARVSPDWLTPHLFLGVAHANLNNKAAALRELRLVVARAQGDPSYAVAQTLILRLEGK